MKAPRFPETTPAKTASNAITSSISIKLKARVDFARFFEINSIPSIPVTNNFSFRGSCEQIKTTWIIRTSDTGIGKAFSRGRLDPMPASRKVEYRQVEFADHLKWRDILQLKLNNW